MATEDVGALAEGMIRVGKRAVKFQLYLLRRAWGVYYAVWALAFFFFTFLPPILVFILPNMANNPVTYYVGYALVGCMAGYATFINFEKVYKTVKLKTTLELKRSNFYRRLFGVLFGVGYLLLFTSSFYFFGFRGISTAYIALLLVPAWILYALRRSFDTIPLEGLLAAAFYIASVLLSTYFFLRGDYLPIYVAWSATTFIWAFSAFYALYSAPEMLVNED
ncbi:MAG: hypothetical protein QW514_06860 [Thermoprotei archaeon]